MYISYINLYLTHFLGIKLQTGTQPYMFSIFLEVC